MDSEDRTVGLLGASLIMCVSFWMLLKWATHRQMQSPLQRTPTLDRKNKENKEKEQMAAFGA
jgi:hypothetical protein